VRIFKTKEFARFARREGIPDTTLRVAAERAEAGLVDAELGGGLIKQRVARQGQGRRGGYRTLMAFRAGDQTIFLYGFAKSERDNIDADELNFWRRIATGFLTLDAAKRETLMAERELMELDNE
jgi:hypothetical protein